jgi:hypothetical protein
MYEVYIFSNMYNHVASLVKHLGSYPVSAYFNLELFGSIISTYQTIKHKIQVRVKERHHIFIDINLFFIE